MDINTELQKCFQQLGYFSAFPSFHVNPSTSFIWQQLINNVKPRSEVDMCRKKIIIDRLTKKSSAWDPIQFKIREIEVHNELKSVMDDIEKTRTRIQEKQNKEAYLRTANKSNYVINNSINEKIEEKNIKIHALKLKCKHLETEINQVDEMLNEKGVSSVLEENSLPLNTVLDLSTKLLEQIEELSLSTRNPKMLQSAFSCQRNISNILQPSQNSYSTIKKKTNFKIIRNQRSYTNKFSAKTLFRESFKENEMNAENVLQKVNERALMDHSTELLPESCFDFKADEEFLTSSGQLQAVEMYGEENGSKKKFMFEDSINYQGQFFTPARIIAKRKCDYFERANSDEDVIKAVNEIFQATNRKIIWNSLCSLRDSLLGDIRLKLMDSKENTRNIQENDTSRLNYIIIKNNLLHLRSIKQIEKLTNKIMEKKSDIKRQLREHIGDNIPKALESQLDNIKFEAVVKFLQREINKNMQHDNMTSLETIYTKIDKVKEDMFVQLKDVEDYMGLNEELMQKMKRCQDQTTLCVRKLTKFLSDSVWAEDLIRNIHSSEMKVYKDFPIDYNKKFCFTDKNFYYRDSVKSVVLEGSTSSDILYMITSLLGHPQIPPERILSEIMRKQNKMRVLESMEYPKVVIEQNNYSLQELQEQENYVKKICETLASHMRSFKAEQILKSSSHIQLNMELWLEMPFRRFMSQERMVDGKTYKEYEENFEYLKQTK